MADVLQDLSPKGIAVMSHVNLPKGQVGPRWWRASGPIGGLPWRKTRGGEASEEMSQSWSLCAEGNGDGWPA